MPVREDRTGRPFSGSSRIGNIESETKRKSFFHAQRQKIFGRNEYPVNTPFCLEKVHGIFFSTVLSGGACVPPQLRIDRAVAEHYRRISFRIRKNCVIAIIFIISLAFDTGVSQRIYIYQVRSITAFQISF